MYERERDCVLLYSRERAATNDRSTHEIITWHDSVTNVSLSAGTTQCRQSLTATFRTVPCVIYVCYKITIMNDPLRFVRRIVVKALAS